MDPFEKLQKKPVPVAKPQKLATATPVHSDQKDQGDADGQQLSWPQKTSWVSWQVKRGGKISPKVFLIGCIVFFLIFLWLVWVWLFYAITSSEFLQVVGLEVDDIRNLLTVFAVLFFGIIFFAGFYMLVLNIYRLATVKTWKTRYVFGLIVGVVVLGWAIWLGTVSILRIRSLVGETRIQTNQIVLPYVNTRDERVWVGRGIPLIAPLYMSFQVNRDNYTAFIARDVRNNQITKFTLHCWNDQKIQDNAGIYLGNQNGFFTDGCLYTKKGTYRLKLEVGYFDRASGDEVLLNYDLGVLNIPAEIELKPLDDALRFNDRKDEQIIGTAPVIMDFRSQLLFSDLRLERTRVQWDLDGDRQIDVEDSASFQFQYRDPKLYTINYRLPDLWPRGNTWFTFNSRVLQSDLPVCTMVVEQVEWADRVYRFRPWFSQQISVQKFVFALYDTQQRIYLETLQTSQDIQQYTFPRGGQYEVHTTYFTSANERGKCESVSVDVGFSNNQVDFDVLWRQWVGGQFAPAWTWSRVVAKDNRIVANLLPVTLQFVITQVRPDRTAKVTAWYNGTQIFPIRENVYEISSSTIQTWTLEFRILTAQGRESRQSYEIVTARNPVQAQMQVSSYVWEDPLVVVLDASMSPLYDVNDEIVFFTRDFGDGTIQQNVSQGIVEHTYRYDADKNKGEYYPSVTLRTRLWFEDTFKLPTAIMVKRQQNQATVVIESHPTQQARVNDLVRLVVESDWVINGISWDFGNGRKITCADRSCASTVTRYEQPWEYTIRVQIDYQNNIPTTSTAKIRVFE
jgi:hypothetical protein